MWSELQSAKRDRPLRFRDRLSEEIMQRLGLPVPKNKNRSDARASILAEAWFAGIEGRAVSYSRRKQHYADCWRYFGPSGTYANVISEVGVLTDAGFIVEERAQPGSLGHQSTIQATVGLYEAIPHLAENDVSFHLNEVLILRIEGPGGLRRKLAYSDTAETRIMRKQITRINHEYADLALRLPCALKNELFWVIDGKSYRTEPLYLCRIFNRARFDCGGRAYGFFQRLPKAYRSRLLLEGCTVSEPDYSAIHPSLIYAERGLRLVGDPYEINGFERAEGKQAFVVAVNARTRREAIGALVHRHHISYKRSIKLIAELELKHRAIADIFCSDSGVRCMKKDSELILAVTCRCLDRGIPALPVHDSLIVPQRYEQTAAGIMVDEFGRRYPEASPCEVKTK